MVDSSSLMAEWLVYFPLSRMEGELVPSTCGDHVVHRVEVLEDHEVVGTPSYPVGQRDLQQEIASINILF